MFRLFLLVFLLSPRLSFAANPVVTVTNFPDSVVVGDTFPITFTVSSGSTGVYHYKAVGEAPTDISIYPSCAGNYNNCFNIAVSDTSPVTATAYAKINTTSTTNKILIRIAESETHSNTADSSYITIQSIQPTPVPTDTSISPTNTPVPPTDAPAPTNTPAPTVTSVVTPTLTPVSSTLTVSNLPTQVTAGQQFTVTLNLHAKTNLSYQFKVYGGVNSDNYSYEVKNGDTWVNGYNGAWDSLPQSSTGADGNSSFGLTVRFKTNETSGTSQLIAKVKEAASNSFLVSSSYTIDVIDPSPTSKPTNTITPTPTPTPTTTLTPIPEATPTDSTSSLLGNILGATSPEASKSSASFKSTNLLPLIFIISGGILLATPLIISKLKINWPPQK